MYQHHPHGRRLAVITNPLSSLVLIGLVCISVSVHQVNAFGPSASASRVSRASTNYITKSPSSTCLYISELDEPSQLLYQEQEKLIVSRGELEEQLIQENKKVSQLIASKVKVRGAGKAGGFGASSSTSKSKKSALKAESKTYQKTLLKDGVVRIDNVLSDKTAGALREYVYDLRLNAMQEIQDPSTSIRSLDRFANVLLKKDRCDLTIPFGDDIVYDALHQIIRESPVGQTFQGLLSDEAVLYELSCLMSDPGSQRQVVHPDTPFFANKEAVLYTCFIALQDVRLDMGPTTWYPGTHTGEAHAAFRDDASADAGADADAGASGKDQLLKTRQAVLGTLSKGSCAIFDSRCLHCGTANKSDDSRSLFYFSFKNCNIGYPGNPASIRKEIGAANVLLKDLERDLEGWSKGKAMPLLDELKKRSI
jgi:ectoine hydroxylase-related dioxygenase (phytanoyl-CoA dioxygenase family)